MPATAKGFRYPAGSEAASTLDTAIQNLAEDVDASPGIRSYTTAQRDALAADQKWVGRKIWNTTVGKHQNWDGATWIDEGGGSRALRTEVANYVAVDADSIILVDATGAARTITLPDAAGRTGKVYDIKKIDASANAVIIDGDGADTIDGAASASLTKQHESLTIVSDGANWRII